MINFGIIPNIGVYSFIKLIPTFFVMLSIYVSCMLTASINLPNSKIFGIEFTSSITQDYKLTSRRIE
jgi:hypothetical protein